MKYLKVTLENDICKIIINRPEQYNSVNIDVLGELEAILADLKNNNDCKVIILTGEGHKAFIAGADIKSMSNMDSKNAQEFAKYGQRVTTVIEEYPKPIIAAVNGYAFGGGCEIAIACHIRYASENAIFSQPEVNLGLIAGWGGTYRLPKLIGYGRAMEMLLSGNHINAINALEYGLINKIYKSEELLNESIKLASILIEKAPIALSYTIKSINNGSKYDKNTSLEEEQKYFSKLFQTSDTNEGIDAFINKRKAKFYGK